MLNLDVSQGQTAHMSNDKPVKVVPLVTTDDCLTISNCIVFEKTSSKC